MGNPRIYRWLAAGAGVLVAAFLIWFFKTIVFYILIAAVLSLVGKPVVNLICKLRIRSWSPPKWLAAMITLLAMIAAIGSAANAVIPIVLGQIDQLSSLDLHNLADALGQPVKHVEEYINSFLPDNNFSLREYLNSQIAPLLHDNSLSTTLTSITSWIMDIGIAVFSICFITFFFLKDDSLFFEGVVILFPSRYEENIRRALSSTTTLLIRYFVGISIESLIKLICITLPLCLVGFDFNTALVIGLFAAVLNVVPYIGPLIGALIGLAIAMIAPVPGVSLGAVLVQMILIFSIFQLIDNIILQPYIYSSSVKAHPLEIFIVILMAGYIAGVLGMLLAIPAYTVLRVFAKEFFNHFRVVQKLTEHI